MMAGFYICVGAAIIAAVGAGLLVGIMLVSPKHKREGKHVERA